MKIAISQHGHFAISYEAWKGQNPETTITPSEGVLGIRVPPKYRASGWLLLMIESVGVEKAAGPFCRIKVIEIPDGIDWEIGTYDDYGEYVYEKGRSWDRSWESWDRSWES